MSEDCNRMDKEERRLQKFQDRLCLRDSFCLRYRPAC